MQVALYCDASVHGELEGHPGGYAWVAWVDGERAGHGSGQLAGLNVTQAEVYAIGMGLLWVRDNFRGLTRILIYGDNEVALGWVAGTIRARAKHGEVTHGLLRSIAASLDGIPFETKKITRAQNRLADAMAAAASCLSRNDAEPMHVPARPAERAEKWKRFPE